MIKVNALEKRYEDKECKVEVLKNVSFCIEDGEFVAIVGTSGCGKSTLLHILGGVEKESKGSIFIDGVEVTALGEDEKTLFRRKNIGIVYQFYNLFPMLNVRDNILLPLKLDKRKVGEHEIELLLERFHLKHREKHFPSQLSGGEQQRVAIARACIMKPKIMLCDEPTGNLDSDNTKEVMEYLLQLNKEWKQTMLLVTHDNKIASMADRVLTMKDGRIINDQKVKS